ncbi:ATP-dependent sacrificial sulfur transferase LarE [Marmoricola sp. URHB0036]|uniref:ATP-dependent sacrificial sulfur transferase LarE n=1 Tax=Marmoricola sp. URHB0036 TaxID=1298863 RepID=UPI0004193A1C|nr:ATP-dependent sacrificial sulfur transferase LarE [Marmoricola sp. URHB0036]
MSGQLVVGFDLDMTLIDTVVGFAATLDVLGAELGVEFPTAEMTANLGPPLDLLLEPHLPAEQIVPAVERFREIYPDTAVTPTPAFPGVAAALAAVRRHHGRIVLVTGKHTPNAQLHVDHLGLDVDVVEGRVWGTGKGEVLRRHDADIYVGDHVHDVEGARAAGITSVSVLTGGSTREQLEEAGTDVVLADLDEFPAWLDGHLLEHRLTELEQRLERHGRLMVAFSGGADSAFLLAAAVRALGAENVAAATAYSASLPAAERGPAQEFAESLGVEVLTPRTSEMEREGYRANDGDRCAFCKAELLDVLGPLAEAHGYDAVATGTNADDARAGFRPGIAAAADRGAVTPLQDVGLTKDQIRTASRDWGLPTWDKPAAACLSSRVAYGIEITPARLARVERAEAALRTALSDAGHRVGNLRVRDLGDQARIEVDRGLIEAAEEMKSVVRDAGFDGVEVDPLGFRSGSMNELLDDPEHYR